MPILVNLGTGANGASGVWQTPTNPRIYAKTSASSWNGVKSGFVKTSAGWKQFYIDVEDHFTRTTTGTLGNSDNGFAWTNLYGTFYVNGSAAQSDDSTAVSYVETNKTDITITAAVGIGTGVAFWVNPGNSWYAAMIYSDQTFTPYSYSYYCGSYICGYQSTYGQSCDTCYDTCGASTYYAGSRSSCGSGCSWNGFSGTCSCPGYACNPHQCNCQTIITGSTPVYCASYCTASGTTVNTNYYLQIIGGTTSSGYNIVQTVALSGPAAAINVVTLGYDAYVTAYSDAAATSALNTTPLHLVNNPVNTVNATGIIGTKHGIVKAISSNGQTSQVFTFSAKA